jgi:hypothetical protein
MKHVDSINDVIGVVYKLLSDPTDGWRKVDFFEFQTQKFPLSLKKHKSRAFRKNFMDGKTGKLKMNFHHKMNYPVHLRTVRIFRFSFLVLFNKSYFLCGWKKI